MGRAIPASRLTSPDNTTTSSDLLFSRSGNHSTGIGPSAGRRFFPVKAASRSSPAQCAVRSRGRAARCASSLLSPCLDSGARHPWRAGRGHRPSVRCLELSDLAFVSLAHQNRATPTRPDNAPRPPRMPYARERVRRHNTECASPLRQRRPAPCVRTATDPHWPPPPQHRVVRDDTPSPASPGEPHDRVRPSDARGSAP